MLTTKQNRSKYGGDIPVTPTAQENEARGSFETRSSGLTIANIPELTSKKERGLGSKKGEGRRGKERKGGERKGGKGSRGEGKQGKVRTLSDLTQFYW